MFQAGLLLILHTVVGGFLIQATNVSPKDSHIRYVGRFDWQDPTGPRCSWPASEIAINIRGKSLSVKLNDGGQDRFQIVVDGVPTQVLKLQSGTNTYDLASGLDGGAHKIELVKRTESFPGTTKILGFEVNGNLLPPSKPKHILEVIGDSISCGFGNEGKTKEESFSVDTENAYMTYGAITARAVGADLVDIAWSGRKMWPDNSIPEVYDYALPADPNTKWDLSQQIPGVIVINLATNDFGKANPDEKGWTEAYASFIGRLRKRAPKARIYCATGPMMSDNWPPKTKALSTLHRYLEEVVKLRAEAGDKNIALIDFEIQNEQRDGIGSAWHPNVRTHTNMANRLTAALHADLGW